MINVSTSQSRARRNIGEKRSGFSLLELLISVAIIAILMAMYSVALGKALRQAKGVAAAEAIRQDSILSLLGENHREPLQAYRFRLKTGKGNEAIVTEMKYIVQNDAEFRAYWHTLINPDQTEYPTYGNDGTLFAFDPEGNVFELRKADRDGYAGASYPIAWDFISTNMSETALGEAGSNVVFSDGHIEYFQYPGRFPTSPTVAKLSHKFMLAYR